MGDSGRTVRLSQFISATLEPILQEFEEFARTHTTAGEVMDVRALRDHAGGMLKAIVRDMDRPQSDTAQEIKSKGDAPEAAQTPDTAAEKHGTDRASSGFSLQEMFSEYRALRASVLRLWTESRGGLDETDVLHLIRFNEAIDQALAESITSYTEGIGHSREIFLAVLGHDLRTPLGAVVMVVDLIDFTRSRLGKGIPVVPAEEDLAVIGRDVVEEIRATHPTAELRFDVVGDVRGLWDANRVSQALSNLVANAVKHGADDTSIVVAARRAADEVVVSIHNLGRVIAVEDQRRIFDPFERLESAENDREGTGSMGLGLYIAEQIAVAHGGSIGVRSSVEEGTTFHLRLPLRALA